jgi:hypothetical protein
MLTPTASAALLSEFGFDGVNVARPGLYQMPKRNRVGMVVIHQLPEVEETLWLRMLGRGRVQERAISQLAVLPVNAMLLVRLSMLSVEENAVEQARELLTQTLLRSRFSQLDDRLISRLLALSVEALGNLRSRWGEVADEELLGLLDDGIVMG